MNIIQPRKELILPFKAPREQLEGWFMIEVRKSDGRVYTAAPWQRNLITNGGLNNFGTSTKNFFSEAGNGWIASCHVGEGTTPPTVTDTALESYLSHKHHGGSYTSGPANGSGNPPYYRWLKNNHTFAQGQATGTWTEIGLGPSPGNGPITTRALIKDTNGDPTSIVVGASDQVTVRYEIRSYITQLTPIAEQIIIDNVLYDTQRIPYNIDANSSFANNMIYGAGISNVHCFKNTALPFIPADPWTGLSGDLMENRTATLQSYGADTHYRDSIMFADHTKIYWGTKGLTAILMRGYSQEWHMSFTQNLDPTWGIPKDNTNTLTLTLRHSWARYP